MLYLLPLDTNRGDRQILLFCVGLIIGYLRARHQVSEKATSSSLVSDPLDGNSHTPPLVHLIRGYLRHNTID